MRPDLDASALGLPQQVVGVLQGGKRGARDLRDGSSASWTAHDLCNAVWCTPYAADVDGRDWVRLAAWGLLSLEVFGPPPSSASPPPVLLQSGAVFVSFSCTDISPLATAIWLAMTII